MYKHHKISLIMPCLDEEKGLEKVLSDIPLEFDEIIVVDNGSIDQTSLVAEKFGALVIKEAVRGCGRAYLSGAERSRGDILVTMDGDGTYLASDALLLARYLIDEKLDLVFGNRLNGKNSTNIKIINQLGNRLLNIFFMALTFKKINDSQSGMWAVSRQAFDRMDLKSSGFALAQEIKMEALLRPCFSCHEVDIRYYQRLGKSKLRLWRDGANNLYSMFKKRSELFYA